MTVGNRITELSAGFGMRQFLFHPWSLAEIRLRKYTPVPIVVQGRNSLVKTRRLTACDYEILMTDIQSEQAMLAARLAEIHTRLAVKFDTAEQLNRLKEAV